MSVYAVLNNNWSKSAYAIKFKRKHTPKLYLWRLYFRPPAMLVPQFIAQCRTEPWDFQKWSCWCLIFFLVIVLLRIQLSLFISASISHMMYHDSYSIKKGHWGLEERFKNTLGVYFQFFCFVHLKQLWIRLDSQGYLLIKFYACPSH